MPGSSHSHSASSGGRIFLPLTSFLRVLGTQEHFIQLPLAVIAEFSESSIIRVPNSPFMPHPLYFPLLWAELCPPNSYIEALMASFSESDCVGYAAFKELIKTT